MLAQAHIAHHSGRLQSGVSRTSFFAGIAALVVACSLVVVGCFTFGCWFFGSYGFIAQGVMFHPVSGSCILLTFENEARCTLLHREPGIYEEVMSLNQDFFGTETDIGIEMILEGWGYRPPSSPTTLEDEYLLTNG